MEKNTCRYKNVTKWKIKSTNTLILFNLLKEDSLTIVFKSTRL
jgi:hypothetical protein